MSQEITAAIISNQELVREGFRILCEHALEIRVVACIDNVKLAVPVLRDNKPVVALLGPGFSFIDGIDLAAAIRSHALPCRIVFVCGANTHGVLQTAQCGGISVFLSANSSVQEASVAVRIAAMGGTYITPGLESALAREGGRLPSQKKPSPRETAILRLVVDGKSSKEIASILNITAKAVDKLRSHLMRRYDAHNAAELVKCAIKKRLV